MKKVTYTALFAFASAALVACVSQFSGSQVEFRADETVIVKGDEICADFAAKEFNDIGEMSTGKRIPEGTDAKRKIYIGRSAEVEKRLGKKFLDELKDQESVVKTDGNDLFLVGGGVAGTLYAVYDFMEDNQGYRWYFNRKGGDVIDKKPELTCSRKATRRRPCFTGYRKDHFNWHNLYFSLRNRGTFALEHVLKDKGYKYEYATRIYGHGFAFYMPGKDYNTKHWNILPGITNQFKVHPEYFSLSSGGKRVHDAQLCFSNREMRKVFTENVIKYIEARGKGKYMIGSNDNHNDRYCWCKDCIKLEEKYKSVGGPLWDYILELCPELKRRGYTNDVYITSLAYKGAKQTELAPEGIDKFPDNFICDAAFLNADRPVSEMPDSKLPDGRIFNRYENLKKWVSLTHHTSYWYYGGNNPASVYARMQKEIRELRDAGVKSVGSCRTGGGYEFNDMTPYIFYTLLRNPDCDIRSDVVKMLKIKYGDASGLIMQYIDELEESRRLAVARNASAIDTDNLYTGFAFLTGKELVHWQELFDKAEAAVKGKGDDFEANVGFARLSLDVWTIRFAYKVREECPGYKLDMKEVINRGLKNVNAFKAKFKKIGFENITAHQEFEDAANFANLKSNELPPELRKYPKGKVHRFLPPVRRKFEWRDPWTKEEEWSSVEDPDSVCGYAMMDKVPDEETFDYAKHGGIGLRMYDLVTLKYIFNNDKHRIPMDFFEKDKYKLYRMAQCRISPGSWMIFGELWQSPLAMRQLANLYDMSYVNKEFELWVSIKVQGPKFFAGDTRDNAIFIEQVFAVDMGVPEGK